MWDVVAGTSAGVGVVSVKGHSRDSESIGNCQARNISLSCGCEDTQRQHPCGLFYEYVTIGKLATCSEVCL